MVKDPIIIKVIEVGDFSTNCYIVGNSQNSAFIIDPGDELEKIERVIKKYKFKPQFIINTHAHVDHIKEDENFELPVYIHYKDVPLLKDPQLNLSSFLSLPFSFKKEYLIREVRDGEFISFDSQKIEVIHTPGHTPGSICLRLGNYLFSGDTLFCNSVGRTDFPGADSSLLLSSIKEKLFSIDEDLIVLPGHGSSTSLEKEKRENVFLREGGKLY